MYGNDKAWQQQEQPDPPDFDEYDGLEDAAASYFATLTEMRAQQRVFDAQFLPQYARSIAITVQAGHPEVFTMAMQRLSTEEVKPFSDIYYEELDALKGRHA